MFRIEAHWVNDINDTHKINLKENEDIEIQECAQSFL